MDVLAINNTHMHTSLYRDSLNLIECDLVAGAIVELGRARAFVRSHGLGPFQGTTSIQVGRDAGRAEGMAAHLDERAEVGGAALDHAPSVHPVHRLLGQCAGAAGGGAEEGSLAGIADAGCIYISIKIGFQTVMRRHLVPLAAFLVQADSPALALGVVVLDAHGNDGADPGEGEGHDADQRTIAQPDHAGDVDAVQQRARLFGIEHGGLAGFDDMLRPAD